MNRLMKLTIGALALADAAFAADASAPTFVTCDAQASSFWHTATNQTLTVPIDFPDGASSATLSVRGTAYAKDYADVTAESFTFELPAADDDAHEDVYELTLTFDDGTVRTARLGLIDGLAPGAVGSTRCLFDADSKGWARAYGNGVAPVPCGATLTVNGADVKDGDKGFTGAQGWYALALKRGDAAEASLTAGERTQLVSLVGAIHFGTALIVR